MTQLNKDYKKPDFIQQFLGPILENIKVEEESNGDTKVLDTANTRQKSLEKFCKSYIQMYQKLFNLLPIVGYISEDPYLSEKKDAQEFLRKYQEINELIRIDLL